VTTEKVTFVNRKSNISEDIVYIPRVDMKYAGKTMNENRLIPTEGEGFFDAKKNKWRENNFDQYNQF